MRFRLECVLVLLVLASLGCEKSTLVEGTVTLNGEPVKKGSIAFRSPDGSAVSFGSMVKDGKYSVTDAVPGQRIAVIAAVDEENMALSREDAMQAADRAKSAGAGPADSFMIDLISPDSEGNSQTVEIKPGPQTLDFAVTTE